MILITITKHRLPTVMVDKGSAIAGFILIDVDPSPSIPRMNKGMVNVKRKKERILFSSSINCQLSFELDRLKPILKTIWTYGKSATLTLHLDPHQML